MKLTASHIQADTSQPVLETTIGQQITFAASECPDQHFLVTGEPDSSTRRRWTFAESHAQAMSVAQALLKEFQPGERIAVMAHNCTSSEPFGHLAG